MRIIAAALLLVGLAAAPAAAATDDPYDETNNIYQRLHQIVGAKTWAAGNAIVAVVDSGVSANIDLPADRIVAGHDFIDDDDDASDPDNRGTLIASIIASTSGNGVGASGVCPECRIMPIRAVKRSAGTTPTDYVPTVAKGIIWAADHGAKIITYPYGIVSTDPVLAAAIDHAAAKDALVIAPAGSGSSEPPYPAALDSVLAVGGVSALNGVPNRVDTNFNTADNRWIDVSAFIRGVATNSAGGQVLTGTTYVSEAIVAGAAGLAYSINPHLTAADLRREIVETANPIPGQPDYYPPVLDASRLLVAAGATDTVAPVITGTGLKDNQVVGPGSMPYVKPVVTDDHQLERTEVLLDGTLIGEWRPWTLDNYVVRLPATLGPDGPHQVTVRARDYGGNVTEKTTTVVVDTVAPAAEILQPAAGAHVRSGTTVVVRADETAVVATLGGANLSPVGDGTWTGKVTTGGLAVQVSDLAGNTTALTRSVVVDDHGPSATGFAPGTNARLRGTFTSTISGVADATGVAYTQLWVNNVLTGTDFTAPYSLPVRTTGSGTVKLVWRLVDPLGNVTMYTRYPIADNTAPTVSITKAPANKAKVKGTVKVYVSAKDASGIARVQLLINGKVVATDTTASYVLPVNTAKVARTMKVQVRAYDKLGNLRVSSVRTWTRK